MCWREERTRGVKLHLITVSGTAKGENKKLSFSTDDKFFIKSISFHLWGEIIEKLHITNRSKNMVYKNY